MTRLVVLAFVAALAACDSPDPMQRQKRYEPYRRSSFFSDGRMMRPPPEDTVPREKQRGTGPRFTGREGEAYVDVLPIPVTRALLERGRERFEATCAACHGLLGDGESPVARNMALQPPPPIAGEEAFAFVERRWKGGDQPPDGGVAGARAQADLPHPLGFYFEAITQGYGLMPSYADMISNDDRWAVIAYLRALSRSERVKLADLPPDVRARLDAEGAP